MLSVVLLSVSNKPIMLIVIMLSVANKPIKLIVVLLSVSNKPIMLIVITLSVVMLIVVAPKNICRLLILRLCVSHDMHLLPRIRGNKKH